MERISARQQMEFRGGPIKSSLKNPDTLSIIVHRHKQNNQEDLVKNRISINIIRKKSIVMSKTMPLLIRYLVTKIFRKKSRNKPKETETYDFTPIRPGWTEGAGRAQNLQQQSP